MQFPRITDLATFFLRRPALLPVLAIVGGAWASLQLYKLASFTYLHTIHRSTLSRYRKTTTGKEDNDSWALVTGASDGIGKGFAEELCAQGFNVILHGRNATKLDKVKSSLLSQWPQRKVDILVLDAMTATNDPAGFEAACAKFRQLKLRVIVNNVAAGFEPHWVPFEDRSARDVTGCLAATATFATEITRVFMPTLLKNQPALIINVGSGISELPVPYMSVYAAAKAYNKVWSSCLATEMKTQGQDVEVLFMFVGMVSTNAPPPREVSLMVPSSRGFAKSCLTAVGCGHSVIWPYWPHALQFAGLVMNLPSWVQQRAVVSMARKMKAEEDAKSKDK